MDLTRFGQGWSTFYATICLCPNLDSTAWQKVAAVVLLQDKLFNISQQPAGHTGGHIHQL